MQSKQLRNLELTPSLLLRCCHVTCSERLVKLLDRSSAFESRKESFELIVMADAKAVGDPLSPEQVCNAPHDLNRLTRSGVEYRNFGCRQRL